MSIREMANALSEYCFYRPDALNCDSCLIRNLCKSVHGDFFSNPVECTNAYNIIQENNSVDDYDSVNKPKHYNRKDAMQCIDEMCLIFGKEAVKYFCLCNAWKYRYRAIDKNGIEDLHKSDFYIRKYKELCDEQTDI